MDDSFLGGNPGIGDEDAASGRFAGHDGVGDVHGILMDDAGIAVKSAIIVEVEVAQRFAGGYQRIVLIVQAHQQFILANMQEISNICYKRRISTHVLRHILAVDPQVG